MDPKKSASFLVSSRLVKLDFAFLKPNMVLRLFQEVEWMTSVSEIGGLTVFWFLLQSEAILLECLLIL